MEDFHRRQGNGQLSSLGPNEASIKLHIKSFRYPVYQEVFKYNFYSFTADLGAILGLFIGLSFIHIVKGIIIIPLFLTAVYERRNEAKVVDHDVNESRL